MQNCVLPFQPRRHRPDIYWVIWFRGALRPGTFETEDGAKRQLAYLEAKAAVAEAAVLAPR